MTVSEIKRLAGVLGIYNPKASGMPEKELLGLKAGRELKAMACGEVVHQKLSPLISPAHFCLNLSSVQLTGSVKKQNKGDLSL